MTVATDTVIRVEGLAARFDGRTVFEHVGFDVRRGEVFVILGGLTVASLSARRNERSPNRITF